MEGRMLANGNAEMETRPATRVREIGLVLPDPPAPLGAYVESADTGNLLFLTGMLPVVKGKLAVNGRLGESLSVEEGQKAARIAALNALAAAQHHLGDLDRLKKLVKLTVQIVTTDQFIDHAAVADGASKLFVQIFGANLGHTRVVYGVQSIPIGAPVMIETIFEIC
jgi:enamine deaminase RidA (YjgF/YER057c/UK114 family)